MSMLHLLDTVFPQKQEKSYLTLGLLMMEGVALAQSCVSPKTGKKLQGIRSSDNGGCCTCTILCFTKNKKNVTRH